MRVMQREKTRVLPFVRKQLELLFVNGSKKFLAKSFRGCNDINVFKETGFRYQFYSANEKMCNKESMLIQTRKGRVF